MFKKIATLSVWNLVASVINFLSNFIIVKFFGVAVFGEFSSYSALIALGALIFVVLPPSYSVLKYQDDNNYKLIFANFFLISSIFYIFFLVLLDLLNVVNVPIFTSILYSTSLAWQNYFDVTFQAKNQLRQYFVLMAFISVAKVLVVLLAFCVDIPYTFGNLLLLIGFGQLLPLLPFLFVERTLMIKAMKLTKVTIKYIGNNFTNFKGYYLNIGLKRMQEYSSILLFTPLLSKETLGVFSLFVKVISFVLGFSRIFEMFFNVRENISDHFSRINAKSTKIGIALQLFFIATGVVYLFVLLDKFYFFELIILSFLFPIFTKYIFARAYFLSKFQNIYLNWSSLIFIVVNLLSFIFCWCFHISSLTSILFVYFSSNFLSNYYLIYMFNKQYQ